MTDNILSFHLCGKLLGVDVTLVKEINRNIEYTPIPGAKDHIIGFFNMRGQVVTLFNLAKLLNLGEMRDQEKLTCIILKKPKDPDQVGFLIESPGDVLEYDSEEYEATPANVGTTESEYIESVLKLKDELLLVINCQKIFGGEGEKIRGYGS
jgi:purine-binding chemotaxis protein CheW